MVLFGHDTYMCLWHARVQLIWSFRINITACSRRVNSSRDSELVCEFPGVPLPRLMAHNWPTQKHTKYYCTSGYPCRKRGRPLFMSARKKFAMTHAAPRSFTVVRRLPTFFLCVSISLSGHCVCLGERLLLLISYWSVLWVILNILAGFSATGQLGFVVKGRLLVRTNLTELTCIARSIFLLRQISAILGSFYQKFYWSRWEIYFDDNLV